MLNHSASSDAFAKLLDALAVLAALTLLAMVVMVSGDIILRNLTRTGFPWADESPNTRST